jgi:hypothetical protein
MTYLGKRGSLTAVAISVAACGVLSACASGSSSSVAASAPAPATVSVTSSVTVTRTAPSPKRNVAPRTVKASKPAAKSKAPASVDSAEWTMPNEVGRVLQDAQDDLQRVSGDPVFFSHSHDLRGSRFQILDADWKVCTQNVAPGTRLGQVAHVDFGVVKLYESCP